MARQLGLQSLHLPEAYGGQGFSFVELVIVLEEMGRALLCAPYLASVCLAANAVLNGASETQRRELIPGIAAGETIATLAFVEPSARWDASGIGMEAVRRDGGRPVRGTKIFLLHRHIPGPGVVAAARA